MSGELQGFIGGIHNFFGDVEFNIEWFGQFCLTLNIFQVQSFINSTSLSRFR
jgi:hypothetical protein